jgi:hypothetical protein
VKNWNSADREQWSKGIKAIASAMLPDMPDPDSEQGEDMLLDLETLFMGGSSINEKVLSVEEGLRQFQLFLLHNYVRPGMASTEYLEVAITRTLGADTVTYKLGCQFDINSGAGRTACYDRLVDAINIELDRYARDRAGGVKSASSGAGTSNGNRNVITIPAIRLNVDVKQGKKYFKVTAGEWQEFGVNFWPEDIKRAGVDPDSIPLEGWDLSKFDAEILMNGEKPKKVIRLIRRVS